MDFKPSDFVSAPRKRGIAPARPGASLLTAVGRTHPQLRHATVVDRLTQNSSVCTPPGANGSSAWAHAQIGRQSRRPPSPALSKQVWTCLDLRKFRNCCPTRHRSSCPRRPRGGGRRESGSDRCAHLLDALILSSNSLAQASRPWRLESATDHTAPNNNAAGAQSESGIGALTPLPCPVPKPAYLAASGPIGTIPACDPATGLLQGTAAKRVVPQ